VTAASIRPFRYCGDVAAERIHNRVSAYAVDTTYQQQLRELNDMNWERFKADMHATVAQSESRLSERISDLLKWMIVFWSGTILSVGGLIIALMRK
jgi:hypothetical protein